MFIINMHNILTTFHHPAAAPVPSFSHGSTSGRQLEEPLENEGSARMDKRSEYIIMDIEIS